MNDKEIFEMKSQENLKQMRLQILIAINIHEKLKNLKFYRPSSLEVCRRAYEKWHSFHHTFTFNWKKIILIGITDCSGRHLSYKWEFQIDNIFVSIDAVKELAEELKKQIFSQ